MLTDKENRLVVARGRKGGQWGEIDELVFLLALALINWIFLKNKKERKITLVCEVIERCYILFGDMFTRTYICQNLRVLHLRSIYLTICSVSQWKNKTVAEAWERRNGGNGFNQFSRSVMSNSLWPHGLLFTRLPCPSSTPGAYSNSCPSCRWYYPTISSSVIPFSFHLQSFPASGSFPMSQFFMSGGQSIGVSASTSVLPMNIQDWFPLG